MHLVGTNFATIAVALLSVFCHVTVLAAPAVPDLDSPDEAPEQKHVIRVRSADEEEEDANEEYEEYEEEYEEDGEEGEGRNVEMETVAKIRVVWNNDEEDLYVDDHLQAARMWGIIQGTEGEDFISIKDDDEGPPPSDSTMFITFPTQPPGDYTPQDSAPPEALQNSNLEEKMQIGSNMLQNMYGLMYLGGADVQDLEKMSSFKGLKEVMKNALFGSYSYAGIEDNEGTPVVATPITLAPTVPGEPKRLWAMEAIDLEITTTPDYNRLVLQQAFGNLFE